MGFLAYVKHLLVISYLEREGSLWFFLKGLLGYRGCLGNARRGCPGRSGGYRSGGTDCLGRTLPPGRWRRRRFNLTLQPAQPACLVKVLRVRHQITTKHHGAECLPAAKSHVTFKRVKCQSPSRVARKSYLNNNWLKLRARNIHAISFWIININKN